MKKYYTPEIEEFHVGFEYELYEDFDYLPEKVWHNQLYGEYGNDPEMMDYISVGRIKRGDVRVKYLDKEDIESLGWEFIKTSGHSNQITVFEIWSNPKYAQWKMYITDDILLKETGYLITDREVSRSVKIEFYHPDNASPDIWFYGTIKNKSELKRIMQQLGIEI